MWQPVALTLLQGMHTRKIHIRRQRVMNGVANGLFVISLYLSAYLFLLELIPAAYYARFISAIAVVSALILTIKNINYEE